MFHVERVYGHLKGPGRRFLVDRLWPRGIQKAALKVDGWFKDLAPSNELRKWFHHDPAQYDEFTRRYTAELEANPGAWAELLEAGRAGDVTLLFSAKEETFNNAHVLKDFLERKLGDAGGARGAANVARESGTDAMTAEPQQSARGKRPRSGGSAQKRRGTGARGTRRAAKASPRSRGKASSAGGTKRAAGRTTAAKTSPRAGRKTGAGTKRGASRKAAPKTSPRSRPKGARGRGSR